MKEITPTPEIIRFFKSRPQTLIFEGICSCSEKVALYNENDDYAIVVNEGDRQKVCFSSDNFDFAQEVISRLGDKIGLCGVDPVIIRQLKKKYTFEWETDCYLCVWDGSPLPPAKGFDVRPMSATFAQRVSDGTYYHAPIEEINECLLRHPSAAIYENGEPVCWCLCHSDKSMGMLFTLPQYRRKGYALEVMTVLCERIIQNGDIPFAYILDDNTASLKLAQKYNLLPVKRADYCLLLKNA